MYQVNKSPRVDGVGCVNNSFAALAPLANVHGPRTPFHRREGSASGNAQRLR